MSVLGIRSKMTPKSKKIRNIATLNNSQVHSGSNMGLLKEIVLLEVYVWGEG